MALAKLARAEAQLARARMNARKQDTRLKIELGGLIIKATLEDEDRSVILGLLLEASNQLNGIDSKSFRQRFRALGDRAFLTGE